MPAAYVEVNREDLEAVMETVFLAGDKLASAIKVMAEGDLDRIWLTWNPATQRALTVVMAFARDAQAEAEEEAFAVKRNMPIPRAVAKSRSAKELQRRSAKLSAEPPAVTKPRGRPRKSP